MTDMDLVTIIVPVYNSEKYLVKCIESLLTQTYKTIEIILINDASTDNSLCICKEYEKKYKHITVIDLDANHGQAYARNRGLDIACGKYICFVDSDDYLSPLTIATFHKEMEEDNYDFVQISTAVVDTKSIILRVAKTPTKVIKGSYNILESYIKHNQELISSGVCDKCFRRSVIEDLRMDEGYYYEDGIYILKVIAKANFIKVNSFIGYYYCQSDVSTMRGPYNRRHIESCIYEPMFYNEYLKNFSKLRKHGYAKLCYRAMRGYRYSIICNDLSKSEKDYYTKTFKNQFYENFSLLKKEDIFKNLNIKNKLAYWIFYLSPSLFVKMYYIVNR